MVRSGHPKAQVTSYKAGPKKIHNYLAQFFMPLHVMWFILFQVFTPNHSLHICMLQNVHASKMWEKAPISHRANTIDLSSYPNEKRILKPEREKLSSISLSVLIGNS